MLIGTGVRRAMRRAAGWERQKLGLAAHLPRSVHHRFGRPVGNSLRSARRFVPAVRLGQFFETLGRRGTEYVVIRWFDNLPAAPNGDVDFLVADSALGAFNDLFGQEQERVPCDINAEPAVPGYSYGGLPFYPPALARQMLDRRVTVGKWIQASCPEDHFLGLAYGCVYRNDCVSAGDGPKAGYCLRGSNLGTGR